MADSWEADFSRMEEVLLSMGPAVSVEMLEKLRSYALQFFRYSARVNLVSAGDRFWFSTRHLLPALKMRSLVRVLPHQTVLDLGSGVGLPGIPLKIAFPDSCFVLLESRRRRANFLREVVRQLDLKRIEIVNERVEDWVCPFAEGVELVVSRAVASPRKVMGLVSAHLAAYANVLTSIGESRRVKLARELMLDWSVEGGGESSCFSLAASLES